VASFCKDGGEPICEISRPVDIWIIGISCNKYSHDFIMLISIFIRLFVLSPAEDQEYYSRHNNSQY
jgi:hypothetical protein